MTWIKRLYIFFVGIILSLTVGFGIAAFYPEPVAPLYPENFGQPVPASCYDNSSRTTSADCQKLIEEQKKMEVQQTVDRQKYEKERKEYEAMSAGYTRTAVFLGVALGALFAITGIGFIKRSRLVANGLLFAGVLTAILTRFLISVASLGANTATTQGADTLALIEFGVLVLLSLAFLIVGLTSLKDSE